MLYKYRSLTEFSYLEDIVRNRRLYAARYDELNDRAEGHFYYNSFDYSKETLRIIKNLKLQNRVLSLSRNPSEELMWSHYADGHRGVVFGIELDLNYKSHPIIYTRELISIDIYKNDPVEVLAKRVLLQKNIRWSYEEEERVFTKRGEIFIPIIIKEIIFGSRVSVESKAKIINLVNEFYPAITIKNY